MRVFVSQFEESTFNSFDKERFCFFVITLLLSYKEFSALIVSAI